MSNDLDSCTCFSVIRGHNITLKLTATITVQLTSTFTKNVCNASCPRNFEDNSRVVLVQHEEYTPLVNDY